MAKDDVKYTREHEWIKLEGNRARVGVTDYAAEQMGDVVFVELPGAGETVGKGDSVCVIESVKAVSDVYAPVSGRISEVNNSLLDHRSLLTAIHMARAGSWSSSWKMRVNWRG